MKKYIYLVLSVFVIGFSTTTSVAFGENSDNSSAYAQVSSMKNLFPKGEQLVTLEKVDRIMGIEHQEAKLVIQIPGTYVVTAAGQAGVDKKQPIAGGFVDLWLIINGQDVADSGSRQFLETPESTSVIVSQSMFVLKKGDTLTFGYSSSKPSVGFISMEGSKTQPSIPSFTVSVYKIAP